MKQYGLIEPSIVECRRARSYIIIHDILSIVLAVVFTLVIPKVVSIGLMYAAIVAILILALHLICYHLSVKTTVLGVTRHFVAGHIGVLFDRNFVSPMVKIVAIERHSSFFERLFGATTVRVRTSGGTVCRFFNMDAASVTKLFQVYQKYVVLSEQRSSNVTQNEN